MKSDFFNLLELLVRAKVDFVMVGGFAGVVHGCTYVTQDIDICCDFSSDNLFRLQDAVFDLHAVHRMTPNRVKLELSKDNVGGLKNLYLDTDIGQLDCLSSIDGVGDFQEVKASSEVIEAEGIELRVLSLDSLIKSKRTMNRGHDMEAIIQLESIKKLRDGQG